ncbi:hypothetical protein [Streptomyces sp. NPDC012508]|uniref:hypothetical protein n=1 Tax=Streptomyces sp. NPDC012508 TaxID=3364837 RepID=UPI0036C2E887
MGVGTEIGRDGYAGTHRAQRALAVCAVVAAAPVVLWGLPSYFAAMFVLTGVATAFPLFLAYSRAAFRGACVTIGLLLLVWGAVGVLLGMFLFWPSALLLLLAALADARRRPVVAKVTFGVGALVTAAVLAAGGVYLWHFTIGPALAEPHTFRAVAESDAPAGIGDTEERLKPFGATQVTGSESDAGSYLEVRFPDDLPDARREELRKEIGLLPGFGEAELCPVSECG